MPVICRVTRLLVGAQNKDINTASQNVTKKGQNTSATQATLIPWKNAVGVFKTQLTYVMT